MTYKETGKFGLNRGKKNKSPEANPNEMEIYQLPDKEFEISLKELNELQEDTDN